MAKEKRILDLEKTIKKHQDLYYNAQPEISDAEFDALWDELKALDLQNKAMRRNLKPYQARILCEPREPLCGYRIYPLYRHGRGLPYDKIR